MVAVPLENIFGPAAAAEGDNVTSTAGEYEYGRGGGSAAFVDETDVFCGIIIALVVPSSDGDSPPSRLPGCGGRVVVGRDGDPSLLVPFRCLALLFFFFCSFRSAK